MIEPVIIDDAGVVESAWMRLVRPASLYDEWAIRINFLDASENALHVLLDDPQNPTAMLPLQRNHGDGRLRFIGAPFLERNRGFAAPGGAETLARFYRGLPPATQLDDISGDDPACALNGFRPSDPAYLLDRSALGYESPDSLYQFLPKNIKENLRKIRRKVDAGDISITESELDFALDRVRLLQRARFGDDSWLESPFIYRAFSNLDAVCASIDATVSCILMRAVDEVIAGCISVFYRDSFYMLMAGVNSTASFSGLGSYLHYHCMAQAFDQGCEHIDTGIGDCGWKERWGLRALPQYLFEVPG